MFQNILCYNPWCLVNVCHDDKIKLKLVIQTWKFFLCSVQILLFNVLVTTQTTGGDKY